MEFINTWLGSIEEFLANGGVLETKIYGFNQFISRIFPFQYEDNEKCPYNVYIFQYELLGAEFKKSNGVYDFTDGFVLQDERVNFHYQDFLRRYKHGKPKADLSIINAKRKPMNKAGFAGSYEYHEFPIRNFFYQTHDKFPLEYVTKFFTIEFVESFIKNNETISIQKGTYIDKNFLQFAAVKKVLQDDQIVYTLFLYSEKHTQLGYLYTSVFFYLKETECVLEFIEEMKNGIVSNKSEEDKKNYIYILTQGSQGFKLRPNEITAPEIDFSINYNSDFEGIHEIILARLSKDLSKGLVLLHGIPGTGKTTYIRYLITKLKKKVIYIPPNLSANLSDPTLIDFLIDQSNSILVIEDAENALITRTSGTNASVANILNLTDGLLSYCANIQILATFNTDLKNIDEALMRKGRLIAKYEFKELEADRQKKLCEKLNVELDGSHTLADIYNVEEVTFSKDKKTIGYNKN